MVNLITKLQCNDIYYQIVTVVNFADLFSNKFAGLSSAVDNRKINLG